VEDREREVKQTEVVGGEPTGEERCGTGEGEPRPNWERSAFQPLEGEVERCASEALRVGDIGMSAFFLCHKKQKCTYNLSMKEGAAAGSTFRWAPLKHLVLSHKTLLCASREAQPCPRESLPALDFSIATLSLKRS
jgi:hypothetical protein